MRGNKSVIEKFIAGIAREILRCRLFLFGERKSMPKRFKHPCAYPGCPELTDGQYCQAHQKIADKPRRVRMKEQGGNLYSSRRWRRFRKMFLATHPICSTPGCGKPSTEVEHKIPRRKGGTDDESNLDWKCKPCHSRKTVKDGRWG